MQVALLEALAYSTLRYKPNINDDQHWMKQWLHAEKEVVLPPPEVNYTSCLGMCRTRNETKTGFMHNPAMNSCRRTSMERDIIKRLHLSVIDLNVPYNARVGDGLS